MTTHFECEGSIWALESRFWKLNLVVFGESFLRHFLVRKKSPRFLDHEDVKLFLESSKFDSRKSTLKFAKQILRYFYFLSFWFLSKNLRSHFLEVLILEFLEIEVQIKFLDSSDISLLESTFLYRNQNYRIDWVQSLNFSEISDEWDLFFSNILVIPNYWKIHSNDCLLGKLFGKLFEFLGLSFPKSIYSMAIFERCYLKSLISKWNPNRGTNKKAIAFYNF